ncbi:unnamed protein product [Schistosoma mattheei]|uniref:Uncharacterized protein n=1 Tax=Schistosoma mattheei TaxID=31246 RepID=A0A183P7H1_9TREM|nr:unnamed protein product [Schistosoma mattheei]
MLLYVVLKSKFMKTVQQDLLLNKCLIQLNSNKRKVVRKADNITKTK